MQFPVAGRSLVIVGTALSVAFAFVDLQEVDAGGASPVGVPLQVFGMSLVALAGIWMTLGVVFYKVRVTERGVVSENLFRAPREMPWEVIEEIRRPGMPLNLSIAYVVAKNQDKIVLVRAFEGYREVVKGIENSLCRSKNAHTSANFE